jgi:hypothetical protein
MAFLPIAPIGGYGGWLVLQRTAPTQRAVFEKSPQLQREIDYFRENIEKATTAEALVKDRRLLAVALGAFGLGDEIDKRAFIRKILEEGTDDPKSFANRLNEPRFKALAKAFGYGNLLAGTNVTLFSFREDIIARFKSLEFERAVGESDADMRLAMNFKREIAAIAAGENADRVGWLQAMGQRPLRELLTTAFGLPTSLAQIDVDQQKDIFEQKSLALFGEKSIAVFKDPEKVDAVIRRFFLFRQIEAGPSPTTRGAAALTLLQSVAIGGDGAANLFLSQA